MKLRLDSFIKGAADTTLKSWEARDAQKRDVEKAELLEKLRRETSDYEFARDLKAKKTIADKDLSGYDPATGKYRRVNSEGELLGEIDAPAHVKSDFEYTSKKRNLDLLGDQAALDNYAIDNARADRQLAIQERAAARAGRRSLDADAPKVKLHAKANAITNGLKAAGFDDNVIINAKAHMAKAISEGRGERWLDEFEANYLQGLIKTDQYGKSKKERRFESVIDAKRKKLNEAAL